jgi:hypothetical protein
LEETAKENADREMHVRICREGGKREKDIRQTKKKKKIYIKCVVVWYMMK